MERETFWRYGFGLHLGFMLTIAALAYLGVLPTQYQVVPYSDFWGHLILVGMLAFFLDGALRFRPLIPGRLPWLRLGPVMVLIVAACEEMAQALSPHRTASLRDFAADALGVALFAWLAARVNSRFASNA